MEQICPNCKHSRRGHSKNGCGELLRNGKECSCKKPNMDGGWVMGEEKREW